MSNHTSQFLLQALGQIAINDDSSQDLTRGSRRLLACLIAVGPSGASKDRLADANWPDRLPNGWENSLRMAVSRLRRQLPAKAVPVGEPYRLALDVDQVDVWQLARLAGDETLAVSEADLKWALETPFPDINLGEGLTDVAFLITSHQAALATRFCREAPTSLNQETVSLLHKVILANPGDAGLAQRVVDALTRARHHQEAAQLLRTAIMRYEATMELPAPPLLTEQLAALEQLEARSSDALYADIESDPDSLEATLPAELTRLVDKPFVGRADTLTTLAGCADSLLIGPSGAGKTRLLTKLAQAEIRAGAYVTYLRARPLDPSFAALCMAFPALRAMLGDAGGIDEKATHERSLATVDHHWIEALEVLESTSGHREHRVLIDDAHELDQQSQALLLLMARSQRKRVSFTFAGRSDVSGGAWSELQAELEATGHRRIEMSGLDIDGLHDLVRLRYPLASFEAQRALALELLDASGGLAAHATVILAGTDDTLTIKTGSTRSSTDSPFLQGLSPVARDVGAVAAVLGFRFSISDLISLLGDVDRVSVALDELSGLCHVTDDDDDFDCFEFSHLLVQEALLAYIKPLRRRHVARDAVPFARDPHQRSRYLTAAIPLVSSADAVTAVLESADAYYRSGEWRSAAQQYRHAERLDHGALTPSHFHHYATALDLTGLDGGEPRRRGFDLAAENHDWTAALLVARSGLPGAERPDGDPDRLALLERIPLDSLDREGRFEILVELARHRALAGLPETALSAAKQALSLAAGSEQTALAEVARWTASHHIAPGGRAEPFSADATEGAIGITQTRIGQMSMISALEDGRFPEVRKLRAAFAETAHALQDPLRIWHSIAIDGLLAFERGRWQQFAELIDEAVEFGRIHALQESTSTWIGQQFHLAYAQRNHGNLVGAFSSLDTNLARSSLARAAFALCQQAAAKGTAGDSSSMSTQEPTAHALMAEAKQSSVAVVTDALDRPRSLSVVVIAMLGGLVAEAGDEQLVARSRAYLESRADRSIVVGFGVCSMGPLWRYLVPLASNNDEKLAWAQAAIDLADRSDAVSWQVQNRVTMHELSGERIWLDEARKLAAETDIVINGFID